MFFSDFSVIYDWGREWIFLGEYNSLYPLPATALFGAYSLLPKPIALFALLVASLIILVSIFKRKSLYWIFYIPILQTLSLGNLDILFLGLYQIGTPLSLALMTLKPQLFLFAIPKLFSMRRRWGEFLLWCAALYAPAFIVRPMWVFEWLQRVDDGRISHLSGSSVWSYWWLAAIGILLVFVFHKSINRNNASALLLSFSPATRSYDFSMLAGYSAWLVPASWVLWAISQKLGNMGLMSVLGLLPLAITALPQTSGAITDS